MAGAIGGVGVETLDEAECRRLLAGHSFGRIVLTSGALPAVVPVAYLLVDDMIVTRLSRGWSLRTSLDRSVVAFEVDEIDPASSGGWSIVAVGVSTELRHADRARALELLAQRVGTAAGDHIVSISPTTISGHRIASEAVVGAPATVPESASRSPGPT